MRRPIYLDKIRFKFRSHPVVALLGPRQCGKTTLAQMYADGDKAHWFDLEDDLDLARLENPRFALQDLEGLIVIDEIQKRPDLFPILRVLIDQNKGKQRYLILGSASRDLIRQSSETLAGRIAYQELTPFSVQETGDLKGTWKRGGFPLAYLAAGEKESLEWLKNYTLTYLERDLPALGIEVPPETMRRFWMMISHCHGNLINRSDLGRSMGLSHVTIQRYLDILSGTFMVRQLQPWRENISKRQVKTPKIYFRDSGILHQFLGIRSQEDLFRHPKVGASWEGFALEEVVRCYDAGPEEVYFWALHEQGELDLLLFHEGKRKGFEFKFSDAPKLTKSMAQAIEILNLDSLTVIYPGDKVYALDEKVKVVPLTDLPSAL